MKSKSAPGSSTPTSRPTKAPPLFVIVLVIASIPLGLAYVVAAFTVDSPLLRIALRCLPVVPLTVWTLWFDRARPLQRRSPIIRVLGRLVLFVAVMLFAIAFLGIALNWLYDPGRVV